MKLTRVGDEKILTSPEVSYTFNLKTGMMVTNGPSETVDAEWSPYGPFIADIEISTICGGIGNGPCPHCYKSNTSVGENMPFETFKTIFHKFPEVLTQIAFGIGDINAHPDLFNILAYCREHEVVPNLTTNGYGVDDAMAAKLAAHCGAVAVSRYEPKDVCYNAVRRLLDAGLKQTNIHMLLSRETLPAIWDLLLDYKRDSRLKGLNAIVFLTLKPKGKRNCFHRVEELVEYKRIVMYCLAAGIPFGFDSCSAPAFLDTVADTKLFEEFKTYAEPCESMLFSIYVNAEGVVFPCSFSEGEEGYTGLDLVAAKDFMADVWKHPVAEKFRAGLMSKKDHHDCRSCPVFKLEVK